MICYVFYKGSKMISCKIDNVEYINDNDKEIRGNSNSIKYGDGSNYICLESDTINKNIGDVIDTSTLEDCRSYFTKGKEIWFQEKLQKANEKINILTQNHDDLKQHIEMTDSTVNSIMTEVIPSMMS